MKPTAATVPAENPPPAHAGLDSEAPSPTDRPKTYKAPPRWDPINEPGPTLPFTDPGKGVEWSNEEIDTLAKVSERIATLNQIMEHLIRDRLVITTPRKLDLVAAQLASVIQSFFVILRQKHPSRPEPPLI